MLLVDNQKLTWIYLLVAPCSVFPIFEIVYFKKLNS